MEHHGHSVAGEGDVELDARGPVLPGQPEGGEGVLGRVQPGRPVGHAPQGEAVAVVGGRLGLLVGGGGGGGGRRVLLGGLRRRRETKNVLCRTIFVKTVVAASGKCGQTFAYLRKRHMDVFITFVVFFVPKRNTTSRVFKPINAKKN